MKTQNFLNSNDFLTIEKEDLSSVLAETISNRLQNEMIISNGKIYHRNENYIYECLGESRSDVLIGIMVKYVSTSYQNLSDQDKNNLQLDMSKIHPQVLPHKVITSFKRKLKESYIKANINTIKHYLTRQDIKFDYDMNGIHFLNGRYDLKTRKLEKRTDKHFITKFINRNYSKPKKASVKKIQSIISKLFRETEAQDYILNLLGSVLSGDSVQLQRFLINYGKGSAGKSSLLNIIHSSLGDAYFKHLQNDGLSKKNQRKDKILNSFNPAVRFYIINEVDTSTIDTNLIKQIAEGCIQTTKLYQDGCHTLEVRGTLIFISNHMITFPPDTGINRRLVGYEYKNKFSDDNSEIDNKTIFKKDLSIFKGEFNDDEKNAIFYILAKECYKYLKGQTLNKPDCLKEVEEDLVDANDYWKKFIEDHLIEKAGGKVAVDDIVKMVRDSEHSKRNIQRTQVISEFKDRGLEYDRMKRVAGSSRGVFMGYTWKEDEKTDDDGFIDDKSGKNPLEYEDLKLENQKLQELLKKHNIKF